MTAKQLNGTTAPDGSLYITLTDGAGNLVNVGAATSETVGSTTISGGATGQILYDNAGVLGEYTASAAKTFLSLNNVTNTDTTNATNISSGTLNHARLPALTSSDVGLGSVTNDIQAKASIYPNTVCSGFMTVKTTVDFSQGNTDFPLAVVLPTGFTRYFVNGYRLTGASASLSGATASVWSAAGGTGTALVANSTSITLAVTAENTAANSQVLTSTTGATTETLTFATVYFRVQSTASGTATFSMTYQPAS